MRSSFAQTNNSQDLAAAHRVVLQSLEDLREQQASAVAYFASFLIFAVVAVARAIP
jgi:hypothetical protein